MNEELRAEMAEVEQMVEEAKQHEDYTEKYYILREGMIKLAGGFIQAALLSSLLGWTRHWLKTDNEVYKQIKEAASNNDIKKVRRLKQQIRQGWFWKSYREMASELLDQISPKTCERYIESFVKKGLLESREPEQKAIYRAKWYKANVDTIKEELNKLGFELDHYKNQENGIGQNDEWLNTGVTAPMNQKNVKPLENSTGQNDECLNTEVLTPDTQESPKSGIRQNDEPCRQNDEPSRQNDEHLLNTSFNKSSFNKSDDDDASRVPDKWELDSKYIAFREIFTKTGASDIKKHDEHYQKFVDASNSIGFGKLIQAAEECVRIEGKQAQIVYFLSGQYNQYIQKDKPASNKRKAKVTKMPVSIALAQQETATGVEEMSEEELKAIHEESIRLLSKGREQFSPIN
jgi:anti-sigma28 factor (negative regulator of flagellin synthesis)